MMRGNRDIRRKMNKLGLDMNEVPDVEEVIIKTAKKDIIISKPDVTEMKTKSNTTFTVSADSYEEIEKQAPSFSEQDVQLVCQQAGVNKEKAIAALEDAEGDLARAIILLTEG